MTQLAVGIFQSKMENNSVRMWRQQLAANILSSVQLLSHVWLFETPWTAAHQASLSITNSQSLLKLMSIELVFILCHPFLLLPLIFASIRVFSNESVLRIRWPKYKSFSFSISPSTEYSGMISFRIDWFDLLAVQGTLESSPKREPSYTAGGNVNWYSQEGSISHESQYGDSLKN